MMIDPLDVICDQVLGNVRACAVSYPTLVREGLIWVWARSGPQAEAEAEAAHWKGLAEAIDDEGDAAFSSKHRWYFRSEQKQREKQTCKFVLITFHAP